MWHRKSDHYCPMHRFWASESANGWDFTHLGHLKKYGPLKTGKYNSIYLKLSDCLIFMSLLHEMNRLLRFVIRDWIYSLGQYNMPVCFKKPAAPNKTLHRSWKWGHTDLVKVTFTRPFQPKRSHFISVFKFKGGSAPGVPISAAVSIGFETYAPGVCMLFATYK